MRKNYQGTGEKSKRKFEVIGKRELLVEVPLPMVEVWEELQTEVEELTGQAGLRIIGAILENEVTRRVGHPAPSGFRVERDALGPAAGICNFQDRLKKASVERPRVRTRDGRRSGVEL